MRLENAGEMGLGAALAVAVGGFWSWCSKRAELRSSSPAAQTSANAEARAADAEVAQALGTFVEKLGASWEKHTQELRAEIREQAGQITDLKAAVAACEDHRGEDRARYEAVLAEVSSLRDRIALRTAMDAGLAPYMAGLPPGEQG